MDSFKGTLTAGQACEIVAEAILACLPNAQIAVKPMADGGEGTAEAMMKAANGAWIPQIVMGPLPDMQVEAGFAWFDHDRSALVEMARASGLELLSEQQMNPLLTTTCGTGQLVKAASDYGAERIMLAVGGSATVDGGVGAAAALGWRFLDAGRAEVPPGGGTLNDIALTCQPSDLRLPPVEVLCDVDNPLCGPQGAARIYGPQKGATPKMVDELETGLKNLADVVRRDLGLDVENLPGAGAAGGLAAGAVAFMGARLTPGIEKVVARSRLYEELDSADWVITGEGSFDKQSLSGKVVSGIINAADRSHTRIGIIAGQINMPENQWLKAGVKAALASAPSDMPLPDAMRNCRELLETAARRFAQLHLDT